MARKGSFSTFKDQNELLEQFRDFQMVDLRRAKRTAYEKVWFTRRLSKKLEKHPFEITKEDLRSYLRSREKYSTATYKNALMAMKVFFRDFLVEPELVASFRFPKQVFKPKHILSRQQVKHFYTHLETPKEKALFLLYATSGLRREEILTLTPEDVDFEKRMITPNNHFGESALRVKAYPIPKTPVIKLRT